MAEFYRPAPVGVDVSITKLQRDLFFELTQKGWVHYDSYGRIYLLNKGTDKQPMNCFDNEYKTVLFNDKMTVNSFFIADPDRTYDAKEGVWRHNVSLIVQAQLKLLYPGKEDRKDEYLINEIRLAVKNRKWDMKLTGATSGIDKVFSKFKIDYDSMKLSDIGSYCVVRIDFTLMYDNTKKSNPVR